MKDKINQFEKEYQKLMGKDRWQEAEILARKMLALVPDSSWVLGQLALTLYEQKRYVEAFEYSSKALAYDHIEPLTLWIHAGILEMLGYINQAFNIWEFLVRRSAYSIGVEDCDEGIDWAKSLQVDCLYRMAKMALELDEFDEAGVYIRMLKYRRGRGVDSIYSKEEMKNLEKKLKEKQS